MKPRIAFGTMIVAALFVGWQSGQVPLSAQGEPLAIVNGFSIEQFALRDRSIVYMRVNRATGDAFVSGGVDWQRLAENGTIPSGEYQVLLSQDVEDKDFNAVRFDRTSGRMWILKNLAWSEIKEPR